jgi:hypothetical protein
MWGDDDGFLANPEALVGSDYKEQKAPFFILWIFLGLMVALAAASVFLKPTGLDSALWLGLEWASVVIILLIGYYVFSVTTQGRKISPDYSTAPARETRARLIYLTSGFLLATVVAIPLAYELSRIVRLA